MGRTVIGTLTDSGGPVDGNEMMPAGDLADLWRRKGGFGERVRVPIILSMCCRPGETTEQAAAVFVRRPQPHELQCPRC